MSQIHNLHELKCIFRLVSSPAILSLPENTSLPFFIFGLNLTTFCSDPTLAAFFFGPEIAGIFSDPKMPAYHPTQNCGHIFRHKIAGLFSDPKLAA